MLSILKENRADLFIAFFGVLVFILIPFQIEEDMSPYIDAKFVPYMMSFLVIVFSIIPIFYCFFTKNRKMDGDATSHVSNGEEVQGIKGKNFLKVIGMFSCLLFWIILLPFIGFTITTFVGIGTLMFMMGNRSIYQLLLFPLSVTLVLYYVFVVLLYITLPNGLFY